jgi:hypothetical protein
MEPMADPAGSAVGRRNKQMLAAEAAGDRMT